MKHWPTATITLLISAYIITAYFDGKKIDRQAEEIRTLKNKVWDLENKIWIDSLIAYKTAQIKKVTDSMFQSHQRRMQNITKMLYK